MDNIQKIKIYNNIEVNRLGNPKFVQDVSDPNCSSWDIYDDFGEQRTSDNLYGENPENSICKRGIVAIDFGTSSTVVVVNIDGKRTIDYIGEMTGSSRNYRRKEENPTILHFKDFKKFLENYNSAKGRPKTNINDLSVSWIALNTFKNAEQYKKMNRKNFFNKIKQWTRTDQNYMKIVDDKGENFNLYNFNEKDNLKNQIDLIELYAYYLGSYINRNQRKEIFLTYHLSFPVTFSKKVKQGVIDSFRKGIIKSLPNSIVNNEKYLDSIDISFKASEPLAYAVSAFEAFDVFPVEEETILYSVYDFGGGTTDFDYGLLRNTKGDEDVKEIGIKYDLVNIMAKGLGDLGGENIIEELAIYLILSSSKNIEIFEKYEMKIEYPRYLSENEYNKNENILDKEINSRESAFKNLRIISKKMEEVWLDTLDEEIRKSNSIEFPELFSSTGESIENVVLEFDFKKMQNEIREILRRGIKEFWETYTLFLSKVDNNVEYYPNSRHIIFLAGNSSKSHIFMEEFNKIFNKINEKFPNMELYYPLGTEKAKEKTKNNLLDSFGIEVNGKNGVAFGLTLMRNKRTKYRQLTIGNFGEDIGHNLEKFMFTIKTPQGKVLLTPESLFNKWEYCYKIGDDFTEKIELDIEGINGKKIEETIIITDDNKKNKYLYIKCISETEIQFAYLREKSIKQKEIENNKDEEKYFIKINKI